MKIYIKVKSPGKRRPILDNVPYEIPDTVSTLREFLTGLVIQEVAKYNQKPKDCPEDIQPDHARTPGSSTTLMELFMPSGEGLSEQAATGKVGFGHIYSGKKANQQKAVENALQCFEDGLVRVFMGEQELAELDMPLDIPSEAEFTLIRLTFLAGRLW